jgi:hypothetical protein
VPITDPPHRWDLVHPDQLGMLPHVGEKVLFPYGMELIEAAGQVIARAGGGEMFFVGRSPDSMFDLLSGALDGTDQARRLHRLAYSRGVTPGERHAARTVLGRQGLSPRMLARSHRPVALIDRVSEGGTFDSLYLVLREWTEAEREPWSVIRRKLRFVGLTSRVKTSPNAWRWWQSRDWPAELPAGNIKNVAIDPALWSYLGDRQTKLTGSFHPGRWRAEEPDGPRHDERTRKALAEATALIEFGRGRAVRSRLVRIMTTEPAYAESWLRSLTRQLAR